MPADEQLGATPPGKAMGWPAALAITGLALLVAAGVTVAIVVGTQRTKPVGAGAGPGTVMGAASPNELTSAPGTGQGPTAGAIQTSPTVTSAAHSSPTPTASATTPRTAPAATLCGAAFTSESSGETVAAALLREDGYYGGLQLIRLYYSGLPAAWPGKLNVGHRPLSVSFKADPVTILAGTDDGLLKAWFKGAPTDRDTYWTYFHEPEDNIANGEFTAANFRAAWRHIVTLARASGNTHLHATLILMGWSTRAASHRDWHDYYPGRDVVDVLGWDQYNEGASKGTYEPAANMFAPELAVNRSENLPFAIAETGSPLVGGDTGAKRAAWLTAAATYLQATHAVYVAYFDLDMTSSNMDYRLRDTASKAAWRAFCA